ncbi:hypothetical protein BJX96DRAFT_156355 [Aspergillus floccosus]
MTVDSDTTVTHGLSVNIYGRGDASLGDTPSHMGLALYELRSSTCDMYHVRNPNDTDFVYDPRTQPFDDPVLRGRCELTTFSYEAKDKAAALLSAYGEDKSNIPVFGEGNCQDWVAGAVLMLESARLLKPGEGDFWRDMVNRSADEIERSCTRTNRKWTSGTGLSIVGEPDARFFDTKASTAKPIGKLEHNATFQARMQSLLSSREEASISPREETPTERPFYVSSPFFSQAHRKEYGILMDSVQCQF